MGYFSNGEEGMAYHARYCARCVHDEGGCAVWFAHMLYNYLDCNKKDSILHLLIPRADTGIGNQQCRLFVDRAPGGTEPKHLGAGEDGIVNLLRAGARFASW